MPDLERSLLALGADLEFPPTPDLVTAVEGRLAAGVRRPRGRRTSRAFVIAFAVFVLAVGTAFAVPQSRDFILERLGLQGATIERVETLPQVPGTTATEGTGEGAVLLPEVPTAVSGDVILGERVTLEEAQARVDFEILVPERLGVPDEVYIDSSLPGGRVSLVYLSDRKAPTTHGIGLLVTEFRGDVNPDFIGKLVDQGAAVQDVTVDGGRGFWISGEPHIVFYRDANGDIRDETLRLAGDTLMWERGNLLLRIESTLRRDLALEIARSFRPLS
jgi:hypothetical protein